MAKGMIAAGGGGGTGSDDVTAMRPQVLENYTAVTADSDDEAATGTMKNLTSRASITHASNNATKVILGDAAYVSKNSDGTDRVEIRYNGEKGFIDGNTLFAVPLDVMAAALGITAGDLRTNKQALGLIGIFTNDAVLDPQYLMEGQSGYDDGVLKQGTSPNRGSYGQQATGWSQYNGRVYFGFPRGTYYQTYQSGTGGAAECFIPNADLGLDASKILKNKSIGGINGDATSDATATEKFIYTGKTAYVNGNKITGTMTVQSAIDFRIAAVTDNSVTIAWRNPAKGPYSGVAINMSTSEYPGNGGTRVYTGLGNNADAKGQSSVTITGLSQDTTYYFSIFSYVNVNNGANNIHSALTNLLATTNAKGQQIFTTGGTFTVPNRVTSVDVFLVAGGNGGETSWQSGGDPTSYRGGDGGGGGLTATYKGVAVTPGQQIAVVVGAGGSNIGYPHGGSYSWRGGASSFGDYNITPSSTILRGGGSGGGRGSDYDDNDNKGFFCGGDGGSDGSNGYYWNNRYDGYAGEQQLDNSCPGQGSTTRAFGESGGTLYSGGGGGGATRGNNGGAGAGGAGGGGSGGDIDKSTNGAAGTANTGGGAGGRANTRLAGGGSGIVIVRWGY